MMTENGRLAIDNAELKFEKLIQAWIEIHQPELGSGVRKLFKYCRYYTKLIEENVFKCVMPFTPQVTPQAALQVTEQLTEQAKNIIQTKRKNR